MAAPIDSAIHINLNLVVIFLNIDEETRANVKSPNIGSFFANEFDAVLVVHVVSAEGDALRIRRSSDDGKQKRRLLPCLQFGKLSVRVCWCNVECALVHLRTLLPKTESVNQRYLQTQAWPSFSSPLPSLRQAPFRNRRHPSPSCFLACNRR